MSPTDDTFTYLFQNQRFGYCGRSQPIQCEYCTEPSTWNAVDQQHDRWRMVCDRHFLEQCVQEPGSAARIPAAHPGTVESPMVTVDERLAFFTSLEARRRQRL